MKQWFSTNSSQYHYAFPRELTPCEMSIEDKELFDELIDEIKKSNEQKIDSLTNYVQKMFDNGTYTCNHDVSDAYGTEFTGLDRVDVEVFLANRWQTELNRINDFIDETLEMLQNQLTK